MIINDNIYGKVEINEMALIDLLNAPTVLRLKKICQYGVPDKYYHHKNFSRYKHSVGVMLLLRRLGADIEEQVAGLLHDISHTAFSHIVDWVFAGGREGNEDLQDEHHKKFIANSEIAQILEKHNISVEKIIDYSNFTLLEKEIPDLCADRVDYALQEINVWRDLRIIKDVLDSLYNFDNQIVFKDKDIAFKFATEVLALQKYHWGGFQAVIRYHLFAKALQLAVEAGAIGKADFFQDEDFALKKLENCNSPEVKRILSDLRENNFLSYINKTGQKIYKKFRHVDPKILLGGQLERLSDLDFEFKELLGRYREKNSQPTIV